MNIIKKTTIKFKEIILKDIKRSFDFSFPFPLASIGFCHNFVSSGMFYPAKFEVTIRLSSADSFSTDIINGEKYRCHFPNVAVKIPPQKHYYAIPAPREAFYFSYDLSLAELAKGTHLIPSVPVWEIKLTDDLNEKIQELSELMNHSYDKYVVDKMDLLALQLWEELVIQQTQKEKKEDFIEMRIKKIVSYFQMNYNKHIDLMAVISTNGFSRRSFFRHWKKYFDLSPTLYLRNLKLQEAERLLCESDMNINQISFYLNFKDCPYFCSLFKSRYGKTPLQYKKYKYLRYINNSNL
ncbi:MAG: AraC family transcriptional regulator [Lentisphaeria bacterium]